MDFKVKMDDVYELLLEFSRLQDGNPEQIEFWCKRIVDDVKLKAPDNQAKDFLMEVHTKKKSLSIKVSYVPKLKKLVPETIINYLVQMPKDIRSVFEEIAREYEKQGTVSFIDFM
jgi:hypothetical protein